MTILVIAEHDNQKLSGSTKSALNAAAQLKADIDILCAGFHCESVAQELKSLGCAKMVLHADSKAFEYFLPESLAPLIADLGKNYQYILGPSTTFGKNILPRAAALLDVAQISDVIKILNSNTYQRPIYASNAILTVESLDSIQCMTIRTSAFPSDISPLPKINSEIKSINFDIQNSQSEFINRRNDNNERPALNSAKIVISGGRGLGDKQTFEMLEKIAIKMGAALGASRAAVDAGLVPNDLQVGQTGQIVAPELYIAIGISGAIQHIAGMKDSKIIIAINKDPDAPIFDIADYGLVADLHEVLKEWELALNKLMK